MAAPWVETVVVALLSGGGVRAIDAWLARRDKDREFERASKKDDHEIGLKIREELRKYAETLELRAKAAEAEAKTLRDSGKHAQAASESGKHPAAVSVILAKPIEVEPFSDIDAKLRRMVREEVEKAFEESLRASIRAEVGRVFEEHRGILHRLAAMAEFSIRRAREERGLPNPPLPVVRDPEEDGG